MSKELYDPRLIKKVKEESSMIAMMSKQKESETDVRVTNEIWSKVKKENRYCTKTQRIRGTKDIFVRNSGHREEEGVQLLPTGLLEEEEEEEVQYDERAKASRAMKTKLSRGTDMFKDRIIGQVVYKEDELEKSFSNRNIVLMGNRDNIGDEHGDNNSWQHEYKNGLNVGEYIVGRKEENAFSGIPNINNLGDNDTNTMYMYSNKINDFYYDEFGLSRANGLTIGNMGDPIQHTYIANSNIVYNEVSIAMASRDQHGCRYLQRRLEEKSPKVVDAIYSQIYTEFPSLMVDQFGNYLCQKLFECCNDSQKSAILSVLAPSFVHIAMSTHGTRALQRLLDLLNTPAQFTLVATLLKESVLTLVCDVNGNHVVQKSLSKFPQNHVSFIYSTMAANCRLVASHRHGCCVFQKCLDLASSGYQQQQLAMAIIQNALFLVQNPYGNYVVQYLLDMDRVEYFESLIAQFSPHVTSLSTQKFSSNVIEKCIKKKTSIHKRLFISKFLSFDVLDVILNDCYGNYVVQTLLDNCDPDHRMVLINLVLPILPPIKHTPHGKRIYNKLIHYSFVNSMNLGYYHNNKGSDNYGNNNRLGDIDNSCNTGHSSNTMFSQNQTAEIISGINKINIINSVNNNSINRDKF
ncbi:Pumilio domain-containing protein [Zancudomyces culisetae]|uniref:Pumilio domain-containing protein n=1 Tax=Zancudomyces culisetae TaxID=1213189 RepID=A0A1R1PR80_ZANCU|nr:Pumilio domain-containing protein [Zancudomyces culisetae]|eukprot:OMH83485.1 Pumilio domain-containing protein [Zancudomyces culisetae]